MLTGIHIRNLKRFEDVQFELGQTVVLIGPNNLGKTTALQALALWEIGLRRWNEKRLGKPSPQTRPGVTINRNDLHAIPVPAANLLWRDLHVRSISRSTGRMRTQGIRVDIIVDGVTADKLWQCGLEFDYANEESFYCRPLRLSDAKPPPSMAIPAEAAKVRVAFLPPMSGLADREFIKQRGELDVLIGQGQTAQVLRNLCRLVHQQAGNGGWAKLVHQVDALFGIQLQDPKFVAERSEITMKYRERNGPELDLSASGRGLQQTLLLLAHLYANPGTVLLLDEPDAHLEILRQRQIYQLLTEVAREQGSQVIAASHSEVVLNEAADRDIVIAFVGRPHRIDDRGSQVRKSLMEIGFENYYQAEQKGWVLYLEGPTDLAILRAFAKTLDHPAAEHLERPFVHYVLNQPDQVRRHSWGLREAKPDLVGYAIFDRLDKPLPTDLGVEAHQWQRRELENYLCSSGVLMSYARAGLPGDLFGHAEAEHRARAMEEAIRELAQALDTLGKPWPWSPELKVTDDFLDPLFERYFRKLDLVNLLRKTHYHELARFVGREQIAGEVVSVLDSIVRVAGQAQPE